MADVPPETSFPTVATAEPVAGLTGSTGATEAPFDPLFDPPQPPPEATPAPETNGTPSQEGVKRGAFRVSSDGVHWTCKACEAENPLEAPVCAVCGTPFRELVRDPIDEGEPKDANKAAALSLLLPGAGHAYIGDWGQAIGRAFLSGWIVLVALFSLFQKDAPGSVPIGLLFGFIAFSLWGAAAHDAYRTASGAEHLAIIRGRRFVYLTMSLMGLLMVALFAAGMMAKS